MTSPPVSPPALPGAMRAGESGRALALALVMGVVAAACYVLLRRETSHEYDVYWMLPKVHAGVLEHARHPLSLHVIHALAALLDGVGALHERLKTVSALCSGAAVAVFVHAAWLLDRDRKAALATGAIYAVLPAIALYATVFELHGPYLPFAAAAVWMACRIAANAQRCPAGLCAALGVLTAVASGMHATGHLLAGTLAAWLVLEWRAARHRWRAVAVGIACFGVVHVGITLALAAVLVSAPAAEQGAFLGLHGDGLHDVLRVIAGEWLWPFAPVCVLWLGAFAVPPRRLAAVFALSLLVHLALCQKMLVSPLGYVFHEHGAYQLPLAFFAVLLAVRWLPGVGRAAVFACALLLSIHAGMHPAKLPPDRAFGRLVLQHLQSDPARLVLGGAEYDGVFEEWAATAARGAKPPAMETIAHLVFGANQKGANQPDELALFFHPAYASQPVVVSEAALAEMRRAGGAFAAAADVSLPRFFTLRELPELGGSGSRLFRVEPRQ